MNIDIKRFTPKNKFEDSLLPNNKNTKKIFDQTVANAQNTPEVLLKKSKETSFFSTPQKIERSWIKAGEFRSVCFFFRNKKQN